MARARVSQHVVEVLVPFTPVAAYEAGAPVTAIVSQDVVEVLGSFPGSVEVSQHVIEVLMTENETQTTPPSPGEGSGGVRVFGYAG